MKLAAQLESLAAVAIPVVTASIALAIVAAPELALGDDLDNTDERPELRVSVDSHAFPALRVATVAIEVDASVPQLTALRSTLHITRTDTDQTKIPLLHTTKIGSTVMRVTATSNAIRIAVLF